MKYQRAQRDPLRALTSEMLPYELPLPFGVAGLYRLLRRVRFAWLTESSFEVSSARLGPAERIWLKLVFDRVELVELPPQNGRIVFKAPSRELLTRRLLQPHKFHARRNNGKQREITLLHPLSMMGMTYFFDKHRDSILYFTNRSNFSIRYPYRTARLQARRDSAFRRKLDSENYGLEQFGLEYETVSSYFAYKRYNNINRFYSSSEFRACERKYPTLFRADISKCFDSIYTHTIAWVINGRATSKQSDNRPATNDTFGGDFDRYMQYLNYAETSGIVIGPEISRIFAEIILQEIDVRVERDLLDKHGMHHGRDYEVMRYVDDYFVFLADASNSGRVESVLSQHLVHFKLHLNEQKQETLDTPLQSRMSVAKQTVREKLRARTTCDIQIEPDCKANLYFPAQKVILDYKAVLTDTERQHGELANSYLYELSKSAEETLVQYGKYLEAVQEQENTRKLRSAHGSLVSYLVAVLDVAVFVYSGAPSVSHSVKLARLIALSLRELESSDVGYVELQTFRSKVRREVLAQLSAVRDQVDFGSHTLNLLDCLLFLDPDVDGQSLAGVLRQRGADVKSLNALAVLTLLRCCGEKDSTAQLRTDLLAQAKAIIEQGLVDQDRETERAILLLALPHCPSADADEVSAITGLCLDEVLTLRSSKTPNPVFAWDASEHYFERLQLKASQLVY